MLEHTYSRCGERSPTKSTLGVCCSVLSASIAPRMCVGRLLEYVGRFLSKHGPWLQVLLGEQLQRNTLYMRAATGSQDRRRRWQCARASAVAFDNFIKKQTTHLQAVAFFVDIDSQIAELVAVAVGV